MGSNDLVTTATGTVAEIRDYKPFGTLSYETIAVNTGNKYRFTGKELDSETNLQYFGARYLSNPYARFTAVDPILLVLYDEQKFKDTVNRDTKVVLTDPQQLNNYSYVGSNPLKNIDQDGKILDTLVDIGFITYDLYQIGKDFVRTGTVTQESKAALGLDVLGTAIPGVTGLGFAGRLASKTDDIADAAKIIDKSEKLRDVRRVASYITFPKPKVTDPKLQFNIIDKLFKDTDLYLGGTAEATRMETSYGLKVGGKSHITKAENYARALQNWIGDNANALRSDVDTAHRVLNDLLDALRRN